MASSSENGHMWKSVTKWITSLEVLPPNKINSCQDLAFSLRDGVILCHIASRLDEASISLKSINHKTQMAQFLSLQNIRLFLNACKVAFGLNESELFDPSMLWLVFLSSSKDDLFQISILIFISFTGISLTLAKFFRRYFYSPKVRQWLLQDLTFNLAKLGSISRKKNKMKKPYTTHWRLKQMKTPTRSSIISMVAATIMATCGTLTCETKSSRLLDANRRGVDEEIMPICTTMMKKKRRKSMRISAW